MPSGSTAHPALSRRASTILGHVYTGCIAPVGRTARATNRGETTKLNNHQAEGGLRLVLCRSDEAFEGTFSEAL